MENLQEVVMDQALLGGACAVGIATTETLEAGPESTDITQLLPGARSAISFAYTLLKEGGVVVQNENGSIETVSPEEGVQRMEAMDLQRRGMYEDI